MLQQAKKVIHLQDDEAPIRFFYETVQRYMHAGEAQHA
jgi:hypothetical protein